MSVVSDQGTIQFESDSQPGHVQNQSKRSCVWPRYNSIWKRFTTNLNRFRFSFRLCLTKVQFNLKAIHNTLPHNVQLEQVVSDQGTIQFESDSQPIMNESVSDISCVWPRYNSIWKRFTTYSGFGKSFKRLCLTKVQFNLKAIHNLGRSATPYSSCVWPRYNSIWKRFTTMEDVFQDQKKLCLTKVQFNLKAIHNQA